MQQPLQPPGDDAAPLVFLGDKHPQVFLLVLEHLPARSVNKVSSLCKRLHWMLNCSVAAEMFWRKQALKLWGEDALQVLLSPLCAGGPLLQPTAEGMSLATMASSSSPSSSSPLTSSSATKSTVVCVMADALAESLDVMSSLGLRVPTVTSSPSSNSSSSSSPRSQASPTCSSSSSSTSPRADDSPFVASRGLWWRRIFLTCRRWCWSGGRCNGFKLTNNRTTAMALNPKVRKGRRSVVMSKGPLTRDLPYRELVVDCMRVDGFSVGVCRRKAPLGKHVGSGGRSWGYNSWASFWHDGGYEPYGCKYGEGDVVGIWLDWEHQQLVFYVNGKSQFAACQDARLFKEPVHLAVSVLYESDAVTLLPPRAEPPEAP